MTIVLACVAGQTRGTAPGGGSADRLRGGVQMGTCNTAPGRSAAVCSVLSDLLGAALLAPPLPPACGVACLRGYEDTDD